MDDELLKAFTELLAELDAYFGVPGGFEGYAGDEYWGQPSDTLRQKIEKARKELGIMRDSIEKQL